MSKCVACGGKAKEARIELEYCKVCSINFDNRLQTIYNAKDDESLKISYSKAIKAIQDRDNYSPENRDIVLKYFKNMYESQKDKINVENNDRLSKGLMYEIDGNRGRHLDVYYNKVVITTNLTIGSVITGNATDGKKTIYYKDVIGLQFKLSGAMIGYLQLETAASTMNKENSNFFNENTFTFDQSTTSNNIMEEVEKYIDQQLEKIKSPQHYNEVDELRKFKSLLDDSIITPEEFAIKKKQLLGL